MNPDPSPSSTPKPSAPPQSTDSTQNPYEASSQPQATTNAPVDNYSRLINSTENSPVFDPNAHKMIPVVEKPLDINQVPDIPAQQFNPFVAASTVAIPEPRLQAKTNLLLVALFIIFTIMAVIFGIFWCQAAMELASITAPDSINSSTLTCSLHREPQVNDGLSIEPTYIYRANFMNNEITDIANILELSFSSVEEASSNYHYVEQLVDQYKDMFSSAASQYDYDIKVDELVFATSQDNNLLIFSVSTAAANLSNPFHAQIFGFPNDYADPNSSNYINFDNLTIDELRNFYENNMNYICDISTPE